MPKLTLDKWIDGMIKSGAPSHTVDRDFLVQVRDTIEKIQAEWNGSAAMYRRAEKNAMEAMDARLVAEEKLAEHVENMKKFEETEKELKKARAEAESAAVKVHSLSEERTRLKSELKDATAVVNTKNAQIKMLNDEVEALCKCEERVMDLLKEAIGEIGGHD